MGCGAVIGIIEEVAEVFYAREATLLLMGWQGLQI